MHDFAWRDRGSDQDIDRLTRVLDGLQQAILPVPGHYCSQED